MSRIAATQTVASCLSASILAVGLLLSLNPVVVQGQNHRVLGQWSDGLWYPATVMSSQGNRVRLQFDDGDVATVSPNQTRQINWQVGTRLQCNWKNQGLYYDGVIAAMRGDAIAVHYDDGDREQTVIGRCRSR